MIFFRSEFWTSKNDSLAQDIVGAFIKTVVVAAIAFVALEYVKHTLEIHAKRRALIEFQNGILGAVITDLQTAYSEDFSCTTSVGRFDEESCVTSLKNFQVRINLQSDLVSGILGKDLSVFPALSSTIDTLVDKHDSGLTNEALLNILTPAQSAFRSTINSLAQEIQ